MQVCAQLLGFFQTGEVGYCGHSNAAGEFTVKNLGTGQYRLEFSTEGHVNYVDELLPGPIPLTAGGVIEVEAHLVPGIEIEGTLTEMGTGTPIEGLSPPYSVPAICALNPTTQARVKCATPESGGHYSIAGLPAGTYAVSFAEDWVEEGLDLHPDGYVRRYWNEVPSFGESTLLAGTCRNDFRRNRRRSDQRRRSLPELRSPKRVPAASHPPAIPPLPAAASLQTTTLPQPRPPIPPSPRYGGHGARRAFAV